ncbi:MAG: septum formation inhibitor Maf, partial [Candidatus Dadabacteria bacterium]|nr:septum formation inhibitor Maf [Candidatus Dadabacteria bacterium]NIT13611.1 septum formation inhibitor Maf [Candidatus Dadabacteria bacterium]
MFSSQEWCGHVYTQANHREGRYEFSSYSYFESEGDGEFKLEDALLEDELFTMIRLSPDRLPTGNIKIIPSLLASRLKHFDLKVENALAQKIRSDKTNNLTSYRVKYNNLQREIIIDFIDKFPYQIIGWNEEYKSGFGEDAKVLKTTAVKNKSMLLDYWNKNGLEDVSIRKQLGL